MARKGCLVVALLISLCLPSCDSVEVNSSDNGHADSLEITGLLQKMYKWHEENYKKIDEFPIIVQDTLQIGIDTAKLAMALDEMRNTGFFADTFLHNIKEMAMAVDTTLRNAKVKYYNEINFAFQDADMWINAQDYPEKYWDSLVVKEFTISGDNASLEWKFHKWTSSTGYLVRFIRVDGSWKIATMDGFNKAML